MDCLYDNDKIKENNIEEECENIFDYEAEYKNLVSKHANLISEKNTLSSINADLISENNKLVLENEKLKDSMAMKDWQYNDLLVNFKNIAVKLIEYQNSIINDLISKK